MFLSYRLPNAVRTALAASLLALLGATSTTFAQNAPPSPADLQALRDQLRQLEDKINALEILERNQEIKADAAATAAASTPAAPATTGPAPIVVAASPEKGFSIGSADGANTLAIHALIQADSHWFFNQAPAITNNDAFLIRRARLYIDGTINNNATFLLTPEFAGSSPTLVNAYGNLKVTPEFQLLFGRSKSPVGLEQLQSDAYSFFNERAFVSQIVPNRDIGVYAHGDLFDGTLSYAVGALDGVPDGQNNGAIAGTVVNSDADNDKDFVARLFYQPFKNDQASELHGLGVGIAGTVGREKPASGLAGYKSEAQQTIFSYNTTDQINGKTTRITPQAYYYNGPFGFLGEYAQSSLYAQTSTTSAKEELDNKAWNLSAGYVLTGEDSTYNGVTPKSPFNWANGTWGAFEVVARYDVLDIDPEAFALNPTTHTSLANPATSTRGDTNFGIGLNWYLNRAVRFSVDVFHGRFDNEDPTKSITNNVLKNDENALLTRFEIVF